MDVGNGVLSTASTTTINNSPINSKEFGKNSKCPKVERNVERSDITQKNASSKSVSTSSIGSACGVNVVTDSNKNKYLPSSVNSVGGSVVTAMASNTESGLSGGNGISGGASDNASNSAGVLDDPDTKKSIIQNCRKRSNSNNSDSDVCQQDNFITTNNVKNVQEEEEESTQIKSDNNQLINPSEQMVSYNDFVNLMNDSDLVFNSSSTPADNEHNNKDIMLNASEEASEQHNEIKPLLFEHANEKQQRKGIVKSPSYKSFGNTTNDVVGGANLTGISADVTSDSSRPVLHVQFSKNGRIPSMFGDAANCSSPASSVSSTSSSSDEESSIDQYSEAQPPDGGWGWVVVFASFFVNLIADGITFSFGVIYVEFLNYFGEGKGKTAWIGSLFMAMPLLSGPVASFLTDRYGCRKVTIAGSILACLGFVMSAFSTSMEMLFLTFGVLAGFGLSLCYVAAVVIVAYYFDKRRSFATGLSVCGSGIGTFLFAPLTQKLLEYYGWRGTTLILAGFFLNMMVCGMLMRDLEWTTHRAKLKAKQRKQNKLGISAESFSVSNSTNTGGTASNLHQQPFNIGENDLFVGKGGDQLNPRLFSSLITLPTFMRNGDRVPPEVLELMATHKNAQHVLLNDYPGLAHSRSFSEPLSSSRQSTRMSPEAALSPTNPERIRYEKSKSRQIRNEQAFLTWLKRDGSGQPKDVSYLTDYYYWFKNLLSRCFFFSQKRILDLFLLY